MRRMSLRFPPNSFSFPLFFHLLLLLFIHFFFLLLSLNKTNELIELSNQLGWHAKSSALRNVHFNPTEFNWQLKWSRFSFVEFSFSFFIFVCCSEPSNFSKLSTFGLSFFSILLRPRLFVGWETLPSCSNNSGCLRICQFFKLFLAPEAEIIQQFVHIFLSLSEAHNVHLLLFTNGRWTLDIEVSFLTNWVVALVNLKLSNYVYVPIQWPVRWLLIR